MPSVSLRRCAWAVRLLLGLGALDHALLLARHAFALHAIERLARDAPTATPSVGALDGALTALSTTAAVLAYGSLAALALWSVALSRAATRAGLLGWRDAPPTLALSWLVPGVNLVQPFRRLLSLRRALVETPLAEPRPVARDDVGYREPALTSLPSVGAEGRAPVGLWAALWLASGVVSLGASLVHLDPTRAEGIRTATLLAAAVDGLRVGAAGVAIIVVTRLTAAVAARDTTNPSPSEGGARALFGHGRALRSDRFLDREQARNRRNDR